MTVHADVVSATRCGMKLAQLTAPVNEGAGHPVLRYSVSPNGEKRSVKRTDERSPFWPIKAWGTLCVVAIVSLSVASGSFAQRKESSGQGKSDESDTVRIHLEVTGGDPATPVDSASVYVRYIVKHRMAKDQSVELNLKTNREGVVIVPGVPRGEITIQVVAEHWKPFGQKFQATEDQQMIKVHLEKPPRWY